MKTKAETFGIEPVDVYVGNRVRMRRLILKKSQQELALSLDLTFQQVQKYEKGTNRISAIRLQHLAGLLQVPASLFFEGAPGKFDREVFAVSGASIPDFASDISSTKDGLALILAFSAIEDTSMRRSIVTMVERIADRSSAGSAHPSRKL